MNEVGKQSMEKKRASQEIRKPWGLGEKHEKLEHSLVEKEKAVERQKGWWVHTSQNSFGSHLLCGLHLLMCRLHKYEKGNSSHCRKRC